MKNISHISIDHVFDKKLQLKHLYKSDLMFNYNSDFLHNTI